MEPSIARKLPSKRGEQSALTFVYFESKIDRPGSSPLEDLAAAPVSVQVLLPARLPSLFDAREDVHVRSLLNPRAQPRLDPYVPGRCARAARRQLYVPGFGFGSGGGEVDCP